MLDLIRYAQTFSSTPQMMELLSKTQKSLGVPAAEYIELVRDYSPAFSMTKRSEHEIGRGQDALSGMKAFKPCLPTPPKKETPVGITRLAALWSGW